MRADGSTDGGWWALSGSWRCLEATAGLAATAESAPACCDSRAAATKQGWDSSVSTPLASEADS